MATKYAQGEWQARDGSIVTDEYVIADVVFSPNGGPETVANEKLLAAAPDLLVACQDMLEYMLSLSIPVGEAGSDSIVKAAAAIAKALA